MKKRAQRDAKNTARWL